jgi:hypothetical protein
MKLSKNKKIFTKIGVRGIYAAYNDSITRNSEEEAEMSNSNLKNKKNRKKDAPKFFSAVFAYNVEFLAVSARLIAENGCAYESKVNDWKNRSGPRAEDFEDLLSALGKYIDKRKLCFGAVRSLENWRGNLTKIFLVYGIDEAFAVVLELTQGDLKACLMQVLQYAYDNKDLRKPEMPDREN